MSKKVTRGFAAVAATLAGAAMATGLYLLWKRVLADDPPDTWIVVATVLLTTFVALVASFSIIAGVFHWLGLHDKTQALGLPGGTVRALLAFVLLVTFAIMTVYFFDSIGPEGAATGDQIELSKQVTTALVTLVTALAAFYFGARTGQSETDPAIAAILTGRPATKGSLTVEGANEAKVGKEETLTVTFAPAEQRVGATSEKGATLVEHHPPEKPGVTTFGYTAADAVDDVVRFTLEGYSFEVTHDMKVTK